MSSPVESWLQQFAESLHVRGRERHRFLHECADHLKDAATEHGEAAAVAAFGDPAAIAAELDAGVAARRGLRSTAASAFSVAAVAGSTLALIHSAMPGATGAAPVAAAFFVLAQVSAVSTALACFEALALKRSSGPASAADLTLLARRNTCSLVTAAMTMLAAGVALPGHGSAVALLAGPVLACAAGLAVRRARRLARRLDGARVASYRSPLDDLHASTGLPVPSVSPLRLLALVTPCAAAAAAMRDHLEHATVGQAATSGAVEAIAVVAGFAFLGGILGIRPERVR